MFLFHIPRRASICSAKGESFTGGMEYYSTIALTEEKAGVERRDYCAACWAELNKSAAQQPLSSWKSVVPPAHEKSSLPKEREARALYLLKEALKSDARECEEEAFVLALYLARRRRLLLRQDVKADSDKVFSLYEDDENEEMLCVPKIPLSALQVEDLQRQLAQKFHA